MVSISDKASWYAQRIEDRADIVILEESETPRGWRFRCRLLDLDDKAVRLDWADYQFWCPAGTVPPADVVRTAIQVMLEHGATILDDFDIARIRHVVPSADDRIATILAAS